MTYSNFVFQNIGTTGREYWKNFSYFKKLKTNCLSLRHKTDLSLLSLFYSTPGLEWIPSSQNNLNNSGAQTSDRWGPNGKGWWRKKRGGLEEILRAEGMEIWASVNTVISDVFFFGHSVTKNTSSGQAGEHLLSWIDANVNWIPVCCCFPDGKRNLMNLSFELNRSLTCWQLHKRNLKSVICAENQITPF